MPHDELTDLEPLLSVSAKLVEQAPAEAILQAVCEGVNGLGFQKVLIELPDVATGALSRVPDGEAQPLLLPLRDQAGEIAGRLWADEPEEGLPPSEARPQILALFANLASMAIVSAGQVERLRDEDALTGLRNRRAFMRELDSEVQRALRYGRR